MLDRKEYLNVCSSLICKYKELEKLPDVSKEHLRALYDAINEIIEDAFKESGSQSPKSNPPASGLAGDIAEIPITMEESRARKRQAESYEILHEWKNRINKQNQEYKEQYKHSQKQYKEAQRSLIALTDIEKNRPSPFVHYGSAFLEYENSYDLLIAGLKNFMATNQRRMYIIRKAQRRHKDQISPLPYYKKLHPSYDYKFNLRTYL